MTAGERGNLLTTTDALGPTTTFAYDQFGLLTSVTDPLGHTSRVENDAQGNVSAQVDALVRRTSRTAGGLTTQALHDGADVVLDREEGGGAVEYLHGVGADEHLRQEGPAPRSTSYRTTSAARPRSPTRAAT